MVRSRGVSLGVYGAVKSSWTESLWPGSGDGAGRVRMMHPRRPAIGQLQRPEPGDPTPRGSSALDRGLAQAALLPATGGCIRLMNPPTRVGAAPEE